MEWEIITVTAVAAPAIHEEELYIAWNKAVRNVPFGKIEPLR